MEILEEKIKEFLQLDVTPGCGSGSGAGYGYNSGCSGGYGSGAGYGDGSGFGDGSGYGPGDGFGFGNGDGSGCGDVYSCRDIDGSGYQYSECDGWGKINGYTIYEIDNVKTIITVIHNGIAKGYIVKSDLTLVPTYIVKGSNLFAHGRTIEEAFKSLEKKIYTNLDHDDAIKLFKEKFNNKDSYLGHDFFKWHHIITGSCLLGRNEFVSDGGYNLDNKYTVKQFLEIVKGAYGWNMLKELEKYYK